MAWQSAVRCAAVWSATCAMLALERAGAALSGTEVNLSARSVLVAGAAVLLAFAGLALFEAAIALTAQALRRVLPASVVRWLQATILAAAVAWPLARVGSAIVTGDWVARQKWAPLLRLSVPIGGVTVVLLVSVLLLGRLARSDTRRLRLGAAAAVVAMALLLVDALMLPGLYAAAHLALFAAGGIALLVVAGLAWSNLLPRDGRPRRMGLLAIALVLPIGGAPVVLASDLVTRSRSNLMLASPRAADILPSVTAAPRPHVLRRELETLWEGSSLGSPFPPDAVFPANPAWNVILISFDALRADAVPGFRRTEVTRRRDVPFMSEWLAGAIRFRRTYAQASQTKRSLPPLFRSAEPFEDPAEVAAPLPVLMARQGHVPVAVVPQYFLEPAASESRVLLDGFEQVSVYGNETQGELVDRAREVLGAVRDRPFFAWIHFYALHHPFFAGRPTSPADGNNRRRYRRSLKWTDGEFRRLHTALSELGLLDRSVVVFAADHGEPLGEHGRAGHGWTIYESDIRVPLAIQVPGRPGANVSAVVGNIDIVPTLFELIGAPSLADHHGHSLVPLLADRRASWERPYYIRSGIGNVHGVVFDDDKLVWDREARLFVRFDVRNDPAEVHDLYDPDSPTDRALVRALVRANPDLFAHELDSPEVRRLLLQRLDEMKESTPADIRAFLLRLVALRATPDALRAVERLMAEARDPEIALDVVQHVLARDRKKIGSLLSRRLGVLAGTKAEPAFVTALARRRTSPFEVGRAAQRLDGLSRRPPNDAWEPWLQLVRPWRKPAENFGPALGRMLEGSLRDAPALVPLVLDDIATLAGRKALAEPIPGRVLQLIDHPDLRVRLSAIAAGRRVGGEPIAARIAARFDAPDLELRERQALLRAIASLRGRAAVPAILAAGQDPILALDAVDALRTVGDPAALPFLRGVAKGPFPWYTRERADRAIEVIEGAPRP